MYEYLLSQKCFKILFYNTISLFIFKVKLIISQNCTYQIENHFNTHPIKLKVIFFIIEPFFPYKTSTHLDAKAALLTPQASSLIFI